MKTGSSLDLSFPHLCHSRFFFILRFPLLSPCLLGFSHQTPQVALLHTCSRMQCLVQLIQPPLRRIIVHYRRGQVRVDDRQHRGAWRDIHRCLEIKLGAIRKGLPFVKPHIISVYSKGVGHNGHGTWLQLYSRTSRVRHWPTPMRVHVIAHNWSWLHTDKQITPSTVFRLPLRRSLKLPHELEHFGVVGALLKDSFKVQIRFMVVALKVQRLPTNAVILRNLKNIKSALNKVRFIRGALSTLSLYN